MKFNIVTENFVGYLKHSGARGEIFGGAEVILYDLCKLIQAKGNCVTVLQYGRERREFEFDGVHIRQLKVPDLHLGRLGLTRRFHYGGWFWRNHLDPDVDRVHFHYYYLGYPFGTEDMTGFSHGIDWDCSWVWDQLTARHVRDRISFKIMQSLTKRTVRRLGKIIANDAHFQRYVQSECPAFANRVSVVPNYVDVASFHSGVAPDPGIMERWGNKLRILLPKMPARERGTDIAIRAMARLRRDDIVLLIVGESAGRPIFENMARKHGVDHQVMFLGHRDHFKEMPACYAASDIVIVPSPCREATPLAVLEGMASGKPVVASRIGGIPEIISTDDVGILMLPTDADLAEKLRRLLDAPAERRGIGSAASQHVRRLFTKGQWDERIAAALAF